MNSKRLTSIALLTFFICITALSQQKKIDSSYTKYFKNNREIPYLHLNKTSFLKGEEIWFKAYVLDLNTQRLHENTSNLYCGIYDDKGELKEKKMLYVKKGISSGSFKIDSTYTNENYYIKAFTNYMNNFEEDESFLQKITIINNQIKNKEKVSIESKYDLQVLPEGGHALADIENVFGVVLKDINGDIPKIKSAKIIDEKGVEILSFKLNQFGLGKATFFVKSNKEYSVRIVLENGKELLKKIPPKKLKGVALGFEDISDNMVKVIVKTNKETLKEINNKRFFVLIHNTNSYYKKEIKFRKEKNLYFLFFKKRKFKRGTNIITLFNEENKPLAERVFFNNKNNLLGSLSVRVQSIDNDSVSLKLDKGVNKNSYYLSTSILPFKTKAHNPSQTIYSKFFLAPYIKGEVKNSSYFFKDINRKKLQELDLLLLTQGWSKYNWYNIFNNYYNDRYEFEKGITIKGVIDMDEKEDQKNIYLISDSFNLFLSKKTKENKVEFKNLYLTENEVVNISYLNKGTLENQKGYFSVKPLFFKDSIKVPLRKGFDLKLKQSNSVGVFILKENELLETVEISKKRRKKFKNHPFMLSNGSTKGYKIEEEEIINVSEFLGRNGFRVISDGGLELKIVANRPTKYPTRVFLDNMEITGNHLDLGLAIRRSVNNYDEIFINKGSSGEIHFFTRKTYKKKDKVKKIFKEYKIPFGFSVEKEYYQPKYFSTEHEVFKENGAIYWKSNVNIESESTMILKFPKLNQKKVKVFIEGVTEKGELIYIEKILKNLDKQNN